MGRLKHCEVSPTRISDLSDVERQCQIDGSVNAAPDCLGENRTGLNNHGSILVRMSPRFRDARAER